MQALVYSSLVAFLRLVTRNYVRTIEVVGRDHIPNAGPVIFVGNHPNSLVDPVMITTTCGRPVHLAARDGLFSMPHLKPILWALGSVPIKRRQDQPGEAKQIDNAEAFRALHAVLARWRLIKDRGPPWPTGRSAAHDVNGCHDANHGALHSSSSAPMSGNSGGPGTRVRTSRAR